MAAPPTNGAEVQVEDGDFTRIHNAIMGALAQARLSALELRLTFYLLRMTYGWQKKEDILSISQFMDGTGSTNRTQVSAALKNLLDLKVIHRHAAGQSFAYGFNKYIEQWHPSVFTCDHDRGQRFHKSKAGPTSIKLDTSITPDTSIKLDTKTSIKLDTHKRKKKEESISSGSNGSEPKTATPQQQFFDAVCKCVGWDYKVITVDQKGQIAQVVGILQEGGYTIQDLRDFYTYWFNHDYRGLKKQFPTLNQLRAEIGKLKLSAIQVSETSIAAEVFE
jgi:phage replication O-like protein O